MPKTRSQPSPAPGVVKALLPEKIEPQLATLATSVPSTGQWLYEIKFDGYRLMARIENGKASLITRGGHDWSSKMPGLVAELDSLGLRSAWLDGEIVVLDENGLPSFNRLQKAFDRRTGSDGIDYFVFDAPYFDGYDLRGVPLVERRNFLKAFLEATPGRHVRYSADFPGDAASVLEAACRMKLEGVIVKRADSLYASRRTETWLKLKCKLRQEFVIAGYTDRSDGSPQVGSLLLGVYGDNGDLVSVGSVGTGWDSKEASDLTQKLAQLEVPKTLFTAGVGKPGHWSRRVAGSERWVTPKLVAEVEYAERTPDGQIRHASYVALRSDKAPKTIRRETAKTPAGSSPEMATDAIKQRTKRTVTPTTEPLGSTARKKVG